MMIIFSEDIVMSDRVGEIFQQNTKYGREKSFGNFLDWENKPSTYKKYQAKRIPLTIDFTVKSRARTPFIEVLRNRKSIRAFSNEPMRISELAFLLWTSTGIRKDENGNEFRTAPSAGALYPIETYIVVNNVEGLKNGLYHYDIQNTELEELKVGELGEEVAHSALGQKMCIDAQVVFIWTAIFSRSTWKYNQRAYRYVYEDAGHIAQNLALSATSIGLGSCQIGAFFDDEINKIIDVDGTKESTIYLSVVGHPL
jgi:SagB-type dehydrogenase family enzyme